MVDIESNRFRIRSNGGIGGYTLTNLDTRESKQVSGIPDVKTLAAITEKQFDDEMLKLWNKG